MKMFGLAALAAVAAMAFVGATSASALTNTQLCKVHHLVIKDQEGKIIEEIPHLKCPEGAAATKIHSTLAAGTVGKLLSPITVLCLGVLVESSGTDVGALAKPQRLDATTMTFTGCGTGAAHENCTVEVEALPDNTLLKLGLDNGTLEALNGSTRLKCPNIGINCLYDVAGSLFTVGAQHLTANETPTVELGGKFVCPNEGFLDGLLKTLPDDPETKEVDESTPGYVLQ